ncbi:MAG: helix-turn-helix transcriptional regulator [Burkholderiaceae bacterium]|nr:helix-turn-helix transcriptional regulator [Burkholderiaceae bacterium]
MEPHLFGQRVKARRIELKLTQAQLGELVGVSQVSIKKIEAGGSTRHGRKIAEALNTSLELLETGSGAESQQNSRLTDAQPAIDDWPFGADSKRRYYALSATARKEVEDFFLVALATIESKQAKKSATRARDVA